MKVGLQLPHMGPLVSGTVTLQIARRAEEVGFDSVWVGDHIMRP